MKCHRSNWIPHAVRLCQVNEPQPEAMPIFTSNPMLLMLNEAHAK
jgi:hypothetical protein